MQRMSELENDLDEVLHLQRQTRSAAKTAQPNLLSELFTKEELDEENRLALGEQTCRTIQNVQL